MRPGLSLDEYVSMLHSGQDPHQKLRELAQNRKEEVGPWSGICCKSCWNATEDKCVCHCLGENHGKGLKENIREQVIEDLIVQKEFEKESRD